MGRKQKQRSGRYLLSAAYTLHYSIMVILYKGFLIFFIQPLALDQQKGNELLASLLRDYLSASGHALHTYLGHAK